MSLTEADWLKAERITDLGFDWNAKEHPRKWRLFAAACCRRAIDMLAEARLESVVELVTRFADEMVDMVAVTDAIRMLADLKQETHDHHFKSKYALRDACDALEAALETGDFALPTVVQSTLSAFRAKDTAPVSIYGVSFSSHGVNYREKYRQSLLRYDEEAREQLHLARDIFGNPFRPVAFDPAWLTADAAGIAARMYDSRDFSAMPILADALEEAGCTNPDILLHSRELGVHVRGCWVVDLVLGKS